MEEFVKCSTPYCKNIIMLKDENFIKGQYTFCPKCKKEHSLYVLKKQVEHNQPIKDLILDAKLFKTANGMADYVGISFVTMYNWIEKYFGMSFQEFRRAYICRSDKCYLLNIERSSYSRNDYILKKIRSRSKHCACINSLDPNYIMTNAPREVVSSILRGYPRINQISDNIFALAPKPFKFREVLTFKFKNGVKPFHFQVKESELL